MSELPLGKISPEIFKEIIYPRLGARSSNVIIGPQNGVDIAITKIGNKVMATTTDPVFIVKEYGFKKAAWFAVHILVSDIVTSGLKPAYLSIDLNLPVEINKEELKTLWETVHEECEKLGIAIISGHTARYDGCNYPMVGGATVIAIGDEDEYIAPTMAAPGDDIIVTKGCAIEAAGLFAATFPDKIKRELGEEVFQKADELFFKMSVVKEAELARKFGLRDKGITSMHDATEGGVFGGLYEVARASNVGMDIHKEKIIIKSEVEAICKRFEMDPYISISEGTMIITIKPAYSDKFIKLLKDNSIEASVIGKVNESGIIRVFENGESNVLEHPETDPFWGAFAKAFRECSDS